MSQTDPARTVQTFIDLVQRHEQSFYTFVHNVHSKGQGLFDSLMSWIELFLSYARDGLPQPVDLEFILPHGGPERQAIMTEVDAIAQYHYKLKVAHEEKVRQRFDQATGAEQSEEAALLGSVLASLSLSETAVGEAGELADESSDEESEDDGDAERKTLDDAASEQTSIRSSGREGKLPSLVAPPVPPKDKPVSPASPASAVSATTPTSAKLLTVPPTGEDKQRRGSNQSGRSSLDKIRSSINPLRKSPSNDSEAGDGRKGKQQPVRVAARVPGDGSGRNGGKKRHGRKVEENIQPPQIKALAELRPLFVEVVGLTPKFAMRGVADNMVAAALITSSTVEETSAAGCCAACCSLIKCTFRT